jgi:anti-sigma B factor antagonist
MMLADVHFDGTAGAVVGRVTGEIDLSNAESLGRAVVDAVPNEALALVLDLSAVRYLDSAGIHLIYKLREGLRTRGQVLRLVVPEGCPAREALRLSGVEQHVSMIGTVDQALSELL